MHTLLTYSSKRRILFKQMNYLNEKIMNLWIFDKNPHIIIIIKKKTKEKWNVKAKHREKKFLPYWRFNIQFIHNFN